MFIGHYAIGFAGKKWAKQTNLAVLVLAAVFPDILWQLFVLLGWEQVRIDPGNTRFTALDFQYYPWSHSLIMSLFWASLFAFTYYSFTRKGIAAIVIGCSVSSHWLLDWVTHGVDMPIYPGSAPFGLALWNSIAGTMLVEIAMFSIGVGIYVSATREFDPAGRYGLVVLVALLLGAYIGDRFSTLPTSLHLIVLPGMVLELVAICLAGWLDCHRQVRE